MNSLVEKLKMDVIGKSRELDDSDRKMTERNNLLEQQIQALENKLNEQNNLIASTLYFKKKKINF